MHALTKAEKIYLIDDDEIFRFATKRFIEIKQLAGSIEVFANGKRAIDHIMTHCQNPDGCIPQIILLDINMPIMDGWDFLGELEKIDTDIKSKTAIYLLTSSIDDRDIARANKISLVKDYVVKPVDDDKIYKIFAR
jgi:CheY-like chemotaxis protein